MNREELAWAAGFFDGEGSTGAKAHRPRGHRQMGRPPSIVVGVQIRQVDRRVLDRFRRAVGAGKVYGPYEPTGASRQPQYAFRASRFEDVQQIIAALWPFLDQVKRDQAHAALARARDARLARLDSWTCGHSRKPGERQCHSCRRDRAREARTASEGR